MLSPTASSSWKAAILIKITRRNEVKGPPLCMHVGNQGEEEAWPYHLLSCLLHKKNGLPFTVMSQTGQLHHHLKQQPQ